MIIVKQSRQHQSNQTAAKKNKLGTTSKENTTYTKQSHNTKVKYNSHQL
jgi:hypothetical protein